MTAEDTILLRLAGIASLAIALLQFVMYFGGPVVYRLCGTPEAVVQFRVRHPGFAFLIELALFVLFGLFATYAFSAAGLVPAMPWRAPALALIAVVYLLRGTLVVFQLRGQLPLSRPRDIAYSVFALIIGVAYAVPTWRSWSHFSS